MNEQPNYYSIIPATVRYDKDLKPNEKLLYGEITSLCNKNGYCYATNDYFANLYDVHKNTVSQWINDLQKKGYINSQIIYKQGTKEIDKRVINLGKETVREIAEIYCENHEYPINERNDTYKSKDRYPINKKQKENNTSINNIYSTTTNSDFNNLKNIFEIIEETFGRTLNSLEYEEINTWLEYNFSIDLLKVAIKKAVLKNIYNISYISKILYEWDKNNIRTVAQVQQSDKDYEQKKRNSKNRSNQQKYKSYDEIRRKRLEEEE